MKNRFISLVLSILIIASLFCSFCLSASADSGYFTVKIKSGDTITSVCTKNGINFEKNKNLIMVLNNMSKEVELNSLTAGSTIKLPTISTINSKSAISSDKVKYYVIPYIIEKGDSIAHIYWLWGLRFENYQEDIKALNYKDNLDLLYVGATYLLPTTEANCITATYTTVMSHIMKSNEKVSDVFAAYGIDYKEKRDTLERYNLGRDLSKLSAGDELLIPLF